MKKYLTLILCGLFLTWFAASCIQTEEYNTRPSASDNDPVDDQLDDENPDSGAQEGETFTIPSEDTEASADNIAHSIFDRRITITWSSSGATVEGDERGLVSVSGGHVTIRNSGYLNASDDLDKNIFELKGSSSDGSLKLYGARKACLYLNGLFLTNPSGAVINNQCKKRTFVYVKGQNALSDAANAAYTATGEEDCKAVFFSEGQLVFSGDGSLTVTASNKQGKAGITSDDYLRFMTAPSVKVTSGASAGHGLRGKDFVRIDAGALEISTAAAMKKGVTSDSLVAVNGGTTTVTVSGSAAYDSEDKEYSGTACIKADYAFQMTGGTVTLTNSGRGGKGIRAGLHYDASEKDHTLPDSYVSGGTLIVKTTGARYDGGSSSYTGNNAALGGVFKVTDGTVNVQCTGAKASGNTISSKGIKIGYKADPAGTSKAPGGPGGPGGGGGGQGSKGNEGIECKGTIVISGGEVYVYTTFDDAINSAGQMTVDGGYVMAHSTGNDAMDSNGNMYLKGGCVYAVCTAGTPELAVDANTEGGYKLYVQKGATLVAYGGLERGYSAEQSCSTYSCTSGAWNGLYNGSSYIGAFKALSFTSVTASAPSLSSVQKGVSVSGSACCGGYWAASGISK